MDKKSYFSPQLTGGAVSQRGFHYQTLISIKYLIESMNNPQFTAMSVEQEDDFSLHFEKSSLHTSGHSIQCQVKSVLYDMGDLRAYLDSGAIHPYSRVLICSGFSNDVQSLLEKRQWYEQQMSDNGVWLSRNREGITKNYKEQLEKKRIDFDRFQSVKLDSIPVDYAETITRSTIATWVQKNKRSVNVEALFESLYIKISRLSPVRGTIKRSDVLEIADQCTETREDIYVYLGAMESTESESRSLTPQDRWLYYAENRTADGITIWPSMRYWDNILQQKQPMVPISYIWEPFAWDFPNLDIKVLNNTNETLYLTDIVFEVACSKPDPRPILYIERPAFSSNKRHLALYNDGWGSLKNVNIRINSRPVKNTDFNNYGASAYLGTIDKHQNIDLTEMLHTLTGIDFDGFDQAVARISRHNSYGDDWIDPDHNSALFRRYLGAYAKGIAYVNGILDFDADTIEEQNRHYAIMFSAAVDLYDYAYAGIPAPPSYQYDIQLQVSGESYTVRKSISQVLKPGEIDRFNVRVYCEQSSQHTINVCLMDITGRKIPIDSIIQLDMCVPRSGIQFICRQNEQKNNSLFLM